MTSLDFNGKTVFIYHTALLHILLDDFTFDIRFCLDFTGSLFYGFIQNVSIQYRSEFEDFTVE